MKYITQINSELFFKNGVKLGDVEQGVDGYWYFYPKLNGGSWDSFIMRAVSDHLDAINAPWDNKVKEELEKSDS